MSTVTRDQNWLKTHENKMGKSSYSQQVPLKGLSGSLRGGKAKSGTVGHPSLLTEDIQALYGAKTRFTFNITMVGKPRQTQADKWKKRHCVVAYRAIADEMRRQAKEMGFTLPDKFKIEFWMPIDPNNKRLNGLVGFPHDRRPDLDNLLKSTCDILKKDDSKIHDVHAKKFWGGTGKVIIITS